MIRRPHPLMPVLLGAIDDLKAMEVRGSSDIGGIPMATTLRFIAVVEETRQASDTVDFEMQVSTAAATQKDSTEKTALAVVATAAVATAAVDLTNLFFLLRGDTDTERERRRWGRWTGEISVLFAFAALLTAAGLVLTLHTTVVVVSAKRRRVILVASAAALFVASAGTVLSLLDAQGLWRDSL